MIKWFKNILHKEYRITDKTEQIQGICYNSKHNIQTQEMWEVHETDHVNSETETQALLFSKSR